MIEVKKKKKIKGGKTVVEYGTLAAYEENITTDFTYENADGKKALYVMNFNMSAASGQTREP